jgi:ferritin
MTLNQKLEKMLNDQIREEFESAYLYLSMATWFESKNWTGFGQWMKVQFAEEQGHATKMMDYIVERGGKVNLQGLKVPKTEWSGPLNAFEEALKHEQHITARINALVDTAQAEKDYATNNFLQWFIGEQVEEEAAATQIVEQLQMCKESTGGLFFLDKKCGKRKTGGESES